MTGGLGSVSVVVANGRDDLPRIFAGAREPARRRRLRRSRRPRAASASGPATIRQFLAAGLIDHMHIALVPILLGRGESCGTAWRAWRSASPSSR